MWYSDEAAAWTTIKYLVCHQVPAQAVDGLTHAIRYPPSALLIMPAAPEARRAPSVGSVRVESTL